MKKDFFTEPQITFISRCRSSFESALFATDRYLIEIQNSILSVIVGIWFITYPATYYTYPGTFQYLSMVTPTFWGVIYMVFGVAHLLCLFTGLRKIRRHVMLIKSGLWAFLAITTLSGNSYSIIGYFSIIFMIMTFVTFLKVQIINTNLKKENVR